MKYKRKRNKVKVWQVGIEQFPDWLRKIEKYSIEVNFTNDGIKLDNIVLEKLDHKITVNAGDFLIYEEGLLYSCYYAQFKKFFKKEAKK